MIFAVLTLLICFSLGFHDLFVIGACIIHKHSYGGLDQFLRMRRSNIRFDKESVPMARVTTMKHNIRAV